MLDQVDWTEERMTTLRILWEDVGKSAGEIAKILCVSRNSVIGKVFRMCLTKRRAPPKDEGIIAERAERARARRMKVAALQPKQAAITPEEPIVPVEGGVPLLDLKWYHCRALSGRGDDGLATFCGQPKSSGAYCQGHAQMYYRLYYRPVF